MNNEKMKAAVLHSPGEIRMEHLAIPANRPGHALVRVAAVGVCGSDIGRLLHEGAHKMPLVCGHEFSGTIVEVAGDVEGFVVGDLVAVAPLVPCMQCDQCKTGEFSRCRDYDYFGSRRDGAYAEYVLVPQVNLVPTASGMDPRAAAMVDPAAIALHAIWKAGGVTFGQRAAVVGCGPIGLFAIQWLRLMGVGEVLAFDVAEQKLKLALEAGATSAVLNDEDQKLQAECDLVVEASGHESGINSAIHVAGPGASVVFIGIPVAEVALRGPTFEHFLRKEISLHGAWNSFSAPFPGSEWSTALEALAGGQLRWEFVISHQLELDRLPDFFDELSREQRPLFSKIMFLP